VDDNPVNLGAQEPRAALARLWMATGAAAGAATTALVRWPFASGGGPLVDDDVLKTIETANRQAEAWLVLTLGSATVLGIGGGFLLRRLGPRDPLTWSILCALPILGWCGIALSSDQPIAILAMAGFPASIAYLVAGGITRVLGRKT